MPCSVPSCKVKKNSTFSIPKDENLLSLWEISLGFKLKRTSRICELHFKPEDVIKTWVSGKGLSSITISLKRSKLRPGAVPSVHNEYITNNKEVLESTDVDTTAMLETSNIDELETIPQIHHKIPQNVSYVELDHSYTVKKIKTTNYITSIKNNKISLITPTSDVSSLFEYILNNINLIKIPRKWYYDIDEHGSINNKVIGFHKLSPLRDDLFKSIEKQLIVNKDLNIFLQVNGKKLSITELNLSSNYKLETKEDLENILNQLDIAKVCRGAESINKNQDIQSLLIGPQFEKSFGQWRHSNCTLIIKNNEHKANSKCLWCKRLWYCIKNIKKKKSKKNENLHCALNKDETIKQLQKKLCNIKKKCSRTIRRNEHLHRNVIEIRNQMKEISDSSLKNIIDAANIPECQSEVIYEIFNAAKMKNSKNRKYSENWILQCLLFQMRSPSGYKFLKDQNILPLPCVNTIRKHLMLTKVDDVVK